MKTLFDKKTIHINKFAKKAMALSLVFLFGFNLAQAERLKDLADVQGVRNNQLVGYGLVVGLDGSGDNAPFTNQTLTNMMNQFGITLPSGVDPKSKNVAAVTVIGVLPPFAKPGQSIDITASSIGNAKSLKGGTLLLTPLRGADGNVYAVAQGSLIVGGVNAEGRNARIAVNQASVGRIPNGATVERSVPNTFAQGDTFTFNLQNPDFTTAKRISDQINEVMGEGVAQALDAVSIRVRAPRDPNQRVSYLSVLENLEITPAEARAKIIINSRTGTVVMGKNVRVTPAAVTHGNLVVTIQEKPKVVQPEPFSEGQTAVENQTDVNIEEQNNRAFKFDSGITLDELVESINKVGATPSDLISILEALKQAGALNAELVVI